MVCRNFCKGLIEFSATAISRARPVDSGTVATQRIAVVFKLCQKSGNAMTRWKLRIPKLKVSPPISRSKL